MAVKLQHCTLNSSPTLISLSSFICEQKWTCLKHNSTHTKFQYRNTNRMSHLTQVIVVLAWEFSQTWLAQVKFHPQYYVSQDLFQVLVYQSNRKMMVKTFQACLIGLVFGSNLFCRINSELIKHNELNILGFKQQA